MRDFEPGDPVRIVKLNPDGTEATNYPGVISACLAPPPWIAVEATWTRQQLELDGLVFAPGDRLCEYFSPEHAFNMFVIYAPDGSLRGWYGNVTHPALIDRKTNPVTITWHDLWIDVVALPGGTAVVRDEDELAASGVALSNPGLHRSILDARDELLRRFAARSFPFHER